MILPYVPYGHFAISTWSVTWLNFVFEVNVRDQIITIFSEIPKIQIWHVIETRIITRYCFVSMKTFQRVMMYIRLELTCFSTDKLTQICQKRVPKECTWYMCCYSSQVTHWCPQSSKSNPFQGHSLSWSDQDRLDHLLVQGLLINSAWKNCISFYRIYTTL